QRQQQAFIHAMLDTGQVAELDKPTGSFRNLFSDITHIDKHDARAYFEIKSETKGFDVSGFGQWVHLTHADEVRFLIGQDSLALYRRLYGDDRGFSLTANAEKIDLLPLVADWV